MALVVDDAEAAIAHLLDQGEQAVRIGSIVASQNEPAARISIPQGWMD